VSTQQSFDLARQHHQSGRLAEAETLYRAILAAEPHHADALHLLGVIAGQMGRKADAVDFIQQSIALRPENPEAHRNLGIALKDSGKMDAAIAAFRQAIALKADYTEAHRNLGSALYQAGQLAEAISALREAIALRPDFAEAHSNLGAALRDAGMLEEAIVACRRAIALKPEHSDAHNNLANALLDQGQAGAAIAEYRESLRITPVSASAWYNLGTALRAGGETEEAIAAFRKAIDLKPDHAPASGNLGHALKAMGRNDEAIAAYRHAIALRPDSPDWHHVLDAMTGGLSTTTPASYVRSLFDSYARDFDDHLTGQLHYRVPEQFLDAILPLAPGRQFDILDLGCGTGLCGAQFRPYARHLTGVDLAPAMIAKARERGIYDILITSDITDAMRDREESCDLILAGDLFNYVGALGETFAAAARALRGDGLFAFTLERHDGEGFILHDRVRFAHSLTYVRELSQAHGFTELHVREIAVRRSGPGQVEGWLVVLGKPRETSA
jgi:predicted TPR repeat methyltransferase